MRLTGVRATVLLLMWTGAIGMASASAAQDVVPTPGTRIRVTIGPGDVSPNMARRLTGIFLEDDALAITLKADQSPVPVIIRKTAIARLEQSAGHQSRWRGAGFGAAIGAGTIALWAYVAQSQCHEPPGVLRCFLTPGEAALSGAALGAAGGAAVGAALPPAERWVVIRF